jgi:hypothetical protein
VEAVDWTTSSHKIVLGEVTGLIGDRINVTFARNASSGQSG